MKFIHLSSNTFFIISQFKNVLFHFDRKVFIEKVLGPKNAVA